MRVGSGHFKYGCGGEKKGRGRADISMVDLDAWVAEVRKAVLAKLPDGPVQL